MPFAPSVLALASFRVVGPDDGTGFQLHVLAGLGFGIFQSRVEYKDCTPVNPDQYYDGDIPDADPDKDGNQTTDGVTFGDNQMICDPDQVDEDGWDGGDGRITHFFRQVKGFDVELGMDGYYWFIDNFGINFGVTLDGIFGPTGIIIPNIDIQAGLAFQF